MSLHFLAYWKPSTVRADMETDEPVYHAGSNQFKRASPSDHLWFVTTAKPNRLVLVSHMSVRKIVSHKEAVKIVGPDIWNAKLHVICDLGEAEPMCPTDIQDIAGKLRFQSKRDRLDLSKPIGRELQSLRKLTIASVELLQAAWDERDATADAAEVEKRSFAELREAAMKASASKRSGRETKAIVRKRSRAIKLYVLKRAGGRCEGCQEMAPFLTRQGIPYLEPHHIDLLAEDGADDLHSVVAICPNCHRRAHYANDSAEFREKLLKAVERIENSKYRKAATVD